MKKIKAVFKGQNGSCGYETGKEYILKVSHHIKMYIQIEDEYGGKQNDYESFISFLGNWDNIRIFN